MKALDMNFIGDITYYEFAENIYLGGPTLGVDVRCSAEDEFADSCAAIGRDAIVEINDVHYCGKVMSLSYDEESFVLGVLLLLYEGDDWIDE